MIILMNGPPGSGKDMAATFFKKDLPNAAELKMSKPLKDCFRAMFNFGDIQSKTMLNETKDQPHKSLGGYSPREVQIDIYEWMRKRFGDAVLAQAFIREVEATPANYIIVTDGGMQAEDDAVVNHFGRDKIKCIQLSRPGCTFDNDSRSYLNCEALGIDYIKIINAHELPLYRRQLQRAWIKWGLPVRESAQKLG
jgi:hypothetical protein